MLHLARQNLPSTSKASYHDYVNQQPNRLINSLATIRPVSDSEAIASQTSSPSTSQTQVATDGISELASSSTSSTPMSSNVTQSNPNSNNRSQRKMVLWDNNPSRTSVTHQQHSSPHRGIRGRMQRGMQSRRGGNIRRGIGNRGQRNFKF
ncbi:hypothetical protein QR98_0035760 [Sarcoptes scabiei]|uniref:Uncharacterized protein n=1 Tax=Sarcoptes scabiei TaxID=52283 RepID=A0A132A288_SARSC|nr:hypothetical protein QR98_0035760 [Sarcoptes scabiei]